MAYSVISPKFSFVRFSERHLDTPDWFERQIPGSDIGYALPVYANTDMQYQFILEGTEAEIDAACALTFEDNFQLGFYYGPPLDTAPTYGTFTTAAGSDLVMAERYRIDDTHMLYQVIPDIDTFQAIPVGECFQVILYIGTFPTYATAQSISNRFYRAADTAYSTLFEYYSEQDEAEFYYCMSPSLKNKIRLPLFLTKPGYSEDSSAYRQSDGRTLNPKFNVRKVYEVKTDELPAWIVDNLMAVFEHDTITVTSLPYNGDIVKEGDFTPQYSDFRNYPLATVDFKVAEDGYMLKKNNCAECDDHGELTVIDAAVAYSTGTTGTLNLSPYISHLCCAPFGITVDYYMTSHLVSIPTLAGMVLTYTTRLTAGIPSSAPPFIRLKVKCGGIIKFMNITI